MYINAGLAQLRGYSFRRDHSYRCRVLAPIHCLMQADCMKTLWLLPLLLLLAACGGGKELKPGERMQVMATTVHLASLAMAIAGPDADVDMLAGEGTNPHEYEPTVADRRRLQSSHLLLVNGLELEPFDAGKLARDAKAALVDCSAGIPKDWLITDAGADHGHDHGHGHYNPHVWICTEGAIHQARAITDAFAKLDTANAAGYEKRFGELKQRLEALSAEYKPKVAALSKRKFVSNHDAFPYFAREFGLEQVGVVQRTPGHNPTMDERRVLERQLKAGGADAVFMEPGFDDAASRAIAEGSGLPLETLDPLGVGKPAPDALETTLRRNLETVLKTLGD